MSDTDKCPECGTTLENASGIGPYCPKKGCPYVDGYPIKMIDLLFQKREKKEMSEKELIPCPPGFELVPEGTMAALIFLVTSLGMAKRSMEAQQIGYLPSHDLWQAINEVNHILTRHRATQDKDTHNVKD